MADDGDELLDIDIERDADGDDGDGDLDPVEVDQAVRRILIRDEARIVAAVSLGLIAVGAVFSIGWLFLAWRVEETAASGAFTGDGSGTDADIVDRILALMQVSSRLALSLVLVAAGCGLRLYSSRLFTSRDD